MSKVKVILGKVGLEKAMAAGTAAVAAAGVLLIPADILSNAVVRAGLDTMFSPLQPPLGAKARIGLALLVAGMVFGIVLTAMNVLDALTTRKPAKPRDADADVGEDRPVTPRVRRRDRHPDAPTRAPFSPVRELGAPDVVADEVPAGRIRRLRATPAAASDPAPVPTPWPEREPILVEAEIEPVSAGGANPYLERAPVADSADAPMLSDDVPDLAEPEVADRRSGERRRPPQTGRESINELMERLERALGGPAMQPGPDTVTVTEPELAQADTLPVQDLAPDITPSATEPAGDDRLRSAIEHLRRATSRR